jgi:hypothetical protein
MKIKDARKMTLKNVVPWGRNLEEYKAMFALSEADLRSKLLGCGDGPSSFNAEATTKHGLVVSIDPVYRFSKEEIARRIAETSETVLAQVEKNRNDFVWENIRSVDELEAVRMAAMREFLEDYECGREEKRYIEAELPRLPFEDHAFDLVLCSHFLFLYGDHFDLSFHIDSLLEMCRAGKEVRVFPLIDLKGKRSKHLRPLIDALERSGYRCSIQRVGYEFQKGGNEMLRVQCPG